ncbi:MAG: nodulation protein NfeD [Myxococcales bacterium]|nr:nodulation protein NfeD [Myxococcales bacterium]
MKRRVTRVAFAASLLFLGLLSTVAGFAEPRAVEDEDRRDALIDVEKKRAPRPGMAPASCERERPSLPVGAGKVVIRLEIHDTIDLGLAPYVARILDDAAARPEVALVLVHMNTPGGRVDAAQLIKDALLKSKVPTATLIDTHALSAGALIAYATDFIIVTDGATMGAATPIQLGGDGGAEAVGEKFVSAVRGLFRATAEAKGRDPRIAEAMVDPDVDIPGLKPDGKLVTLTHDELLMWCVADFEARDEQDALAVLGLTGATLEAPELNWAERLARFFTDPSVAGILMSLGMLGIMVELYSPGIGLAGLFGGLCLLAFFAGHLVVNLVGIEELLLFVGGIALLVVELFFFPGGVVAGGLGIVAIVTALILALVGSDVSVSWDTGAFTTAVNRTTISLVASVAVFLLVLRWLPRNRLFGRLVLTSAVEGTAHEAPSVPQPALGVGTRGIAATAIAGSGKARFDGVSVDVLSETGFIASGAHIEVTESRPGRVVVAEVNPADRGEVHS